jgi:hypothetical protein
MAHHFSHDFTVVSTALIGGIRYRPQIRTFCDDKLVIPYYRDRIEIVERNPDAHERNYSGESCCGESKSLTRYTFR